MEEAHETRLRGRQRARKAPVALVRGAQFPFARLIVICEVVIIKLSLGRCDKGLMEGRTLRMLRQLMKTNVCVMSLGLSMPAVTMTLTFLD